MRNAHTAPPVLPKTRLQQLKSLKPEVQKRWEKFNHGLLLMAGLWMSCAHTVTSMYMAHTDLAKGTIWFFWGREENTCEGRKQAEEN